MPQKVPYVQFRRNPIASVVCQLRFHPILRISGGVADFQERIRPHFPRYAPQAVQEVQLNLDALEAASVERTQQHRFMTVDGVFEVLLNEQSLALTAKAHKNRAEFQDHLKIAIDALEAEYWPIAPTRLGLRYVNHIRPAQIFDDRQFEWSEIIARGFLSVPEPLEHLDNSQFMNHIVGEVGGAPLRLPRKADADMQWCCRHVSPQACRQPIAWF